MRFSAHDKQKKSALLTAMHSFLLYQFLIQEILSDKQQLTILWQSPKLIGYEKFELVYHDTVAPKMEEIRYQIDKLELLVADELWTLPKYRELLFIR